MAKDNQAVLNDIVYRFSKLDRRLANLETSEYPPLPAWEDLRTPINSLKLGGVNDPNFLQFQNNGGVSTGVYLYYFDAAAEEEVFFTLQLPHAWREGTTLYPHVHWTPASNGAAGAVVNWGIEYTWANIGDVYGNTSFIYGNVHYPADGSLIADKHYETDLTPIIGTGKTSSSMIAGRLFRDAAGAGGTDDYAHDAGLLELDFHYMISRFGTPELD